MGGVPKRTSRFVMINIQYYYLLHLIPKYTSVVK